MSKSWDSNILKKLKTLVGKGLSTSEIGKRLGMSKNAIVGKLHRLGWNPKATEVVPAKTTKTAKKVADKKTNIKKVTVKKSAPVEPKKTAKADKKTKAEASPKTNKKTVNATTKSQVPPKTGGGHAIASKNTGAAHQRAVRHALEMANLKPNQCRWPIGDPDSEDFHFCGAPVFVGKPYCYEHCKQAYQFVTPKKK